MSKKYEIRHRAYPMRSDITAPAFARTRTVSEGPGPAYTQHLGAGRRQTRAVCLWNSHVSITEVSGRFQYGQQRALEHLTPNT
jgi:hypothetical protein